MTDIKKEISRIAGEVISEYENNPMISEEAFKIFQFGVSSLSNQLCKYFKCNNIVNYVVDKNNILELIDELNGFIKCGDGVNNADAFNEAIKQAVDLISIFI